MSFKFENLEVWNEAIKFARMIYQATKKFPRTEQIGLISQMRNAVISIPSNIAEGTARYHNKDFIRYLRIALGSTYEVVTQLYIALQENYFDESKFKVLYEQGSKVANMLNALIKK